MENNILDFISFIQLKNGNYKVIHDEKHIENIFQLLREMGFGFMRENNHKIYFKRENSTIHPSRYSDFQKAFFKAIKDADTSRLPGNLTLLDVYKYYRNLPLKSSVFFARYFEYDLNEEELQNLSIKVKYPANNIADAPVLEDMKTQ